ncbi:MAG: bifunctional folylpolyglutamate synthase/dihydrofolate synthase [Sphingobacteriales bacterium]|nr:bifunctional folylpolyglutamate synthase/dihydrofolate synthase [Sphingobacteriales bacterium]
MDYSQTLDYLYNRLPMFSRVGTAAYKKDLANTLELCRELGNPQSRFKTIHIAGTNGKGSVSHMLAAIFQSAGYKTGLYTSPHLKDFRERIKVNGEMIPQPAVVDFTEKIIPQIDRLEPSFFEITVAMAFDYFAREKVDIAVIETGLGGRLDSTNIVRPELSIITNIGYDHMNLLGDSLEKIAAEKAGIIKENTAVIIGETLPETLPVFEKMAAAKNSPLHLAGRERQAVNWQWKNNLLEVEVAAAHHTDHKKYILDLPGIYQTKNLLSVLCACELLHDKGWKLDEKAIHNGLLHSKKISGLYGRWEIIHTHPLLVLDVAHNVDGIKQLLQQVELTEHRQLHFVLGMVKDKEVEKVLTLLPANAKYYFTRARIPRALPETELASKAAEAGLKGSAFADVNRAVYAASLYAGTGDIIIVCGSVFLVGEVSLAAVKETWSGGNDQAAFREITDSAHFFH